jgi:hypothetical protein
MMAFNFTGERVAVMVPSELMGNIFAGRMWKATFRRPDDGI